MIYVYAIVDRTELPVPTTNGLEGAPISLLCYRDVGMITSTLFSGSVPTTEANLWRHEEVMDALMGDRALLPVRFNTVLPDERSAVDILASRYEGLVARLDRVRGHVELALRVCWDGLSPVPETDAGDRPTLADAGPGRRYMASRLRQYRDQQRQRRRAEDCANTVHSTLSCLSALGVHSILPSARVLMTAAYLVKSGEVAGFQRELEDLRASHPELRFFCTGPWPPFTFAGEEECENGNGNPWQDAFALGPKRSGRPA